MSIDVWSELRDHPQGVAELRQRARSSPVTLVYRARDQVHNEAVVLAELLRKPSSR